MKATFIGNPNDDKDNVTAVTQYGVTFPLNVPVELPDAVTSAQRKKLANNNHFEVDGFVDVASLSAIHTTLPTKPVPLVADVTIDADADALRAESDALIEEAITGNPAVKVRKSKKTD